MEPPPPGCRQAGSSTVDAAANRHSRTNAPGARQVGWARWRVVGCRRPGKGRSRASQVHSRVSATHRHNTHVRCWSVSGQAGGVAVVGRRHTPLPTAREATWDCNLLVVAPSPCPNPHAPHQHPARYGAFSRTPITEDAQDSIVDVLYDLSAQHAGIRFVFLLSTVKSRPPASPVRPSAASRAANSRGCIRLAASAGAAKCRLYKKEPTASNAGDAHGGRTSSPHNTNGGILQTAALARYCCCAGLVLN